MPSRSKADRIRRHMAKSTPDVVMMMIKTKDAYLHENPTTLYFKWLDNFKNDMVIKHPEAGRIYLLREDDLFTDSIKLTARWVKE